MKKLDMHSPDLTAKNIDALAALFPNCLTETVGENGQPVRRVDFDLLRQELEGSLVEGPTERFRLDWPGKRQALLTANAPIAKTLRPDREASVNFDSTRNMYIEGDNLDALKLLQENYLAKVKMIYIDPPYNTGHDFIYEDDFAEDSNEYFLRSNQKDEEGFRLTANTEANGRFHSDWLSMMYSRLKLARNLLRDDGVIFISVDDGEVYNLKKICDEIFGMKCFVGLFAWRSRTAKTDVPFGVSADVEWILAYAKSDLFVAGRPIERTYYKSDDYQERWRLQDLTTNKNKSDRPNSYFTMVNPRNGASFPANEKRTWAVTEDTFQEYYDRGKIVFPDDYDFLKITKPAFRVFKDEDKIKMLNKYGIDEILVPISTYIPENEVGRTEHGTKEIRTLFSEDIFPYPKPMSLVAFFIRAINSPDDIILDFFSGSATTAHAVMQLNAEDGGNRRFILVQLPEETDEKSEAFKAGYKTIADIGRERIRRAGQKITEGQCHENWNRDTGFRAFKIDSSNMLDVYYTPDETAQDKLAELVDNIKPGRTDEDLLFQVMLDWGLDLALPLEQKSIADSTVFAVDGNALAACFADNVGEELVTELAARKPPFLRVLFRDSSFRSDSDRINVEQIFKQLSPSTEVKVI